LPTGWRLHQRSTAGIPRPDDRLDVVAGNRIFVGGADKERRSATLFAMNENTPLRRRSSLRARIRIERRQKRLCLAHLCPVILKNIFSFGIGAGLVQVVKVIVMEEVGAKQRLGSYSEIASLTGTSPAWITAIMKLVDLPVPEQEGFTRGRGPKVRTGE
jgi:hypothetical protein